jgi:hypothetical protein
MQKTLFLLALIFSVAIIAQQNNNGPKNLPLPMSVYKVMHDSCNYLDIVFITGKGGSMSLDNAPSIRGFTSFVTTKPAKKVPNAPLDGTLMWQINGREYQSGKLYFTSDSSAYITFERNNVEYINAMTPDGAGFLKNRGGR